MENVCELCDGRGWIVEPDGGAGTARRCACRCGARGIEASLMAAGMLEAEIRMASRPWDPARSIPPWTETWARFAARRQLEEGDPERPPCRLIVGPTGSGKTMQAAKVAAAYVHAGGHRLLWCSARSAEQRIMHDRQQADDRLEESLAHVGLLVIDDIAFQLVGLSTDARLREWERETYRRRLLMWSTAIDTRIRAGLGTVITSNLEPGEWGDHALASRLSTPGTVYGRKDGDYRPFLLPLRSAEAAAAAASAAP